MAGRILVVDDLSLNRTILKAKLTAAFFRVETASNGQDALAMVRKLPPDLVLLDYRLPDLNGIQVCTALRADPRTRDVPIILFSASNDRLHRISALEAGADDFLSKPIDESHLMGRVRSLLRHRQLQAGSAGGQALNSLALHDAPAVFAGQPRLGLIMHSAQHATAYLSGLRSALPDARRSMLSLPDAMRLPEAEVPDVLVLTPDLLENRGMQVIADLQSRPSTCRSQIAVMLTPDQAKQAAMALDLGAADVLMLPLDVDEAALRLRALLARKASFDAQDRALETHLDLAFHDPLTGLPNRRYMDLALRDVASHDGAGAPCAVVMVDLDHFKCINDRFGHMAGDQVLKAAALRMRSALRKTDVIARFGGEEFLILLPETGPEQAAAIAERVRDVLMQKPYALPGGTVLTRLTASLGLSVAYPPFRRGDDMARDLIARADECLAMAKAEGRNRVIAANTAVA